MPAAAKPKPARTYEGFQAAYDHFNKHLFGDELPPCLITLQRHKGAYGYFAHERFAYVGGDQSEKTDEIAMNPVHFGSRSEAATLSTLAHEMAHLWQFHFGHPSRAGYHNSEWAAKMREIGLHPTDDGKLTGKPTGQSVTHVVIKGGPFDKAAAAFLASGKSAHLYRDCWVETVKAEGGERKTKNKTKYVCPRCGQAAWAKLSAKLLCGQDGCDAAPMAAELAEDDDDGQADGD